MAYKTHERSKVNYRYPENLKQGAQKSYISFETYVESPLTISGILSKTNENQRLKESKGDNEDDTQSAYLAQTRANIVGGVVGKICGRDNSSSDFESMTVSGKFVDIEDRNDMLSGRRVELYMPISITFQDGATYENTDLGIIGAIGENTLQSGGKSIAGAFLDTVKGGLKTLAGGITGAADGAVGSVLVTELLRNKSGKFTKPLSDVASLATRVTPDANSRVLFKGVAFREFSFQFKLIASSYEEAKQIEGLIRFLRSELYPDIIESISSLSGNKKEGTISLGQRYPNRFQIKMKYGGGRNNDVLNKIKPAYLRAVNTVYNGTQQSFHQSRNDGTAKPFEVDLTLTFQESLKLTRQDVEEGY